MRQPVSGSWSQNRVLVHNFDPEAMSLSQRLGDLPNRFDLYDFDNLVCTRRREFEVACNWKLLIENGMEELHVGTVHQKTIQQYAPASTSNGLSQPVSTHCCKAKPTGPSRCSKAKPVYLRTVHILI